MLFVKKFVFLFLLGHYVTASRKFCLHFSSGKLLALKYFVIEQIYVLKKRLEEKEASPEGNNLLKLLQEEISNL